MNYLMQKQGALLQAGTLFLCYMPRPLHPPERMPEKPHQENAPKVILLTVLFAEKKKSDVQIVGNQV
jgi:hypothetical protein